MILKPSLSLKINIHVHIHECLTGAGIYTAKPLTIVKEVFSLNFSELSPRYFVHQNILSSIVDEIICLPQTVFL